MFNDLEFCDALSLSGVELDQLGAHHAAGCLLFHVQHSASAAPDRAVSFTVPTGNFGDIFAGYVAKRMGLPIEQLIIAPND